MDAWAVVGAAMPAYRAGRRARVSYGSRRVVTAGSPIPDLSDARREQPLNRLSASEQRAHTDCRSRGGPGAARRSAWRSAAARCALAAALVVAAVTAHQARWELSSLLLLIALTTVSDLMSVATGATTLEVSGSFLGLMVAAVLLGGSPAALIGILSITVGWLNTRESRNYFLNNLVVYAWFPLLGGLIFHAVTRAANIGSNQVGYYLLVFAVFMLALGVNFVMVAAYNRYVEGVPISQQAARPLSRFCPRSCSPRCSPSRPCSRRTRSVPLVSRCSRSCSSCFSSSPANCWRQSNAPKSCNGSRPPTISPASPTAKCSERGSRRRSSAASATEGRSGSC